MKPIIKPAEPKLPAGVKTFDFSSEDQDFLQPRQIYINQYKVAITDTDFVMRQYILNNVIPRLTIDPTKYEISYNVSQNKLTCTPKPPEIIKPSNNIIVPGKK